MSKKSFELIVGDNPFHGISHLSQKRARSRLTSTSTLDVKNAAQLVNISVENGANGFMFSVSETTLSILRNIDQINALNLYAIVPYAYEYVRHAIRAGGISGLAKEVLPQIILSKNIVTVMTNIIGLAKADPSAFLDTYVAYEISRIKSASGRFCRLKSVFLHEIITDMALALDLSWLFESYIKFLRKHKIKPGFETRNFVYLINKLNKWDIDLSKITIVAPFNKVGFQMNPSKTVCETALNKVSEGDVIAMSILAAGYLRPPQAFPYVLGLPNLSGVVVGVSKESHARDTFTQLKECLTS